MMALGSFPPASSRSRRLMSKIRVVESTRHGAPMTMVRGGEDRDLAAIVAMGDARARLSRFHLVRDVDFVKFALTRRRLLAGLAPPAIASCGS